MAEDTIGFDTNTGVAETPWANLSYHLGSLFPTVNTDGTHTVRAGTTAMTVDITNGASAAFGVRHNITTTTNLTIGAVATSGAVRWDAVVKRFDWSTNSATFLVVPGTAAVAAPKVAPSGLNLTPGDKYDQVLALVKATNGSTSLEFADRRIWGSKQFTVATVDALPTLTSAHKGATFYVIETGVTYRYSAGGWVPDGANITEVTGSAVLAAATGFTMDATHVNRALVRAYSRQIDIELRRSGTEINADNTNGRFPNNPSPAVCVLTANLRPDRPMPVVLNYLDSTGREYGADGRLNPDGSLYVLGGKAAINLAQSTAVGTVSIRASIRFDRRTA